MKDKIKIIEYIFWESRKIAELRKEKAIELFILDDDALKLNSSTYPYYSNSINSSKLFEAVLKSDLKRIENFKEKFDLEKFKKRAKKYNKLADYKIKKFNENFIDLIEQIKKYIKIPYSKIPQDYIIDASEITDNLVILNLYIKYADLYNCNGDDNYFDRFNFDYDIDTKKIKGEIDEEIRKVFKFSTILVDIWSGALPIDMQENLLKYFRGGRQLKVSQKTKYKLVAEYITIIEKHFKISTGIQRIACELAGVIQYSFSAWKNAKNKAGEKKNFDTYLKWTREKISAKKVEELKTKVANYINSS